MVALGELTHFGAATFDLKLKLVEYLHTELGFNRVVLEAGLFSCREAADALRRGVSAQDAARLCLFGGQFCVAGAFPLFEYSQSTLGSKRPLELSGMDPQLSGTAPRQLLVPRLEEVLGAPVEARQKLAIEHLFSLQLVRTEEQRRTDRNALLALQGRIRQRLGTGSLWARVVEGLLVLDEDHWDYQFAKRSTIETEQLRNQQMGQNVSWWLSQDPNAKVIVWAASVHLARTHRGFDSPVAAANGNSRENGVSAGQWLADGLGQDYFAVAVSAAAGSHGLASGEWRESLGPADASMLEHAALGGALQLLPRSELSARGRAGALLMGGSVDTAEWGTLFDAVLVLPQERPVEARAGCEANRPQASGR
ncbi:MAG: hypothetical protein RL685_2710 [Pseudomonadota bacterium]